MPRNFTLCLLLCAFAALPAAAQSSAGIATAPPGIDALAQNSRHGATEPAVDQFLQRFLGRLHALGTAGDLLLAGGEGTIDAGAVVRATLAPFIGETAPQRFRIDGPDLSLSEQLGAGIGLAVHELATNALKYGALSAAEGSVSITWSTKPIDTGEEIEFVWKERGGPPPSPPEKPGFGSRMIQSVVARERAGRVNMDYQPDGLCCRIAFMRYCYVHLFLGIEACFF